MGYNIAIELVNVNRPTEASGAGAPLAHQQHSKQLLHWNRFPILFLPLMRTHMAADKSTTCPSSLCLIAAASIASGLSIAQAQLPRSDSSAIDYEARGEEFRKQVAAVTTPEFEQRKATRRAFQRKGYATVLLQVARRDGLSALFTLIKNRVHLEYHLPSTPIVVHVPPPRIKPRDPFNLGAPSPPFVITLREDLTFPDDPWSPLE